MKSVIALLLALLSSTPAQAALGAGEDSVAADQAQLKATRRIVAGQQYSMHEIQTAAGTVIREYVSAQGQVFAVVWRGPQLPDLQQILGTYFADFQAAGQGRRAGRGPLQVQQPGLVLHSGGHMRAFMGHAYLPQALPAGVTIDELQ